MINLLYEKYPTELVIDNVGYPIVTDFRNWIDFFAEELYSKPKQNNRKSSIKQILSYLYDSPYVLGAFLQIYGINLRNIDYMHWYEFRTLLDALPEDTPLKKRMSYHAINISSIKDKAEKKRIKDIQRSIALPSRELSAFDIGNQF